MNEWKDLEIGNIPSDFFVNERYEIESKQANRDWHKSLHSKLKRRIQVIHNLVDGCTKYRYRLKPLESMRITRELSSFLTSFTREELEEKGLDLSKFENTCSFLNKFDGRKVEIID